MSKPRRLAHLRAMATPEDRETEALRLPPRPLYRHPCADRPVKPRAKSLEQLAYFCGERGRLAVDCARWTAVERWLRAGKHGNAMVQIAATLAGAAGRKMKGWASPLATMDRSELKYLGTFGAALRAAWERMGQPSLRDAIRDIQRFSDQCDRIDRELANGQRVRGTL